MARLLEGIPPEFQRAEQFTGSFEERMNQEGEALEAIQKRATVIRKQVAGAYAFYEVVTRQPLQIRWIPFCDKRTADPAWVRGLNFADVHRQEMWAQLVASIENRGGLIAPSTGDMVVPLHKRPL